MSESYVLLPTKSPLLCPKSILMPEVEAFKSIRKTRLVSGYLGPNTPANTNKSVLIQFLVAGSTTFLLFGEMLTNLAFDFSYELFN